jgi:mannosyltransferase
MSTSQHALARRPGGLLRRAVGPPALRSVSIEGAIACGLVLVAALIRFLVIDNQSYWMDEALTAYEARLSFGAMLGVVLHVETTPPLYFLVIWAWGHVFGTGAVALRSVSTLAGIATVPLAYLAASELCSRRAGVLAAAFVAINPLLIWYSQEARAYMLLVALCGASFLWFARASHTPSARNLRWWVLWSSLALMTHFFAGFLVAPEALWLLWRWRSRAVAAAVAVVALVQVAMLPFAYADTSHGPQWIAGTPRLIRISEAIVQWGASNLYRQASLAQGLWAGAAVVAITALLAVFGGDQRTRRAVALAAAVAAFVWLVPLALGFLGQDYFISRNVMPAVVPVAVALAAACAAPRARLAGAVFAAMLLAVFAFAAVRVQSTPSLQRLDWRALARALGPARVPRAILASGGTVAQPLKIYLPRAVWTEPYRREISIGEVDVVGSIGPQPLRPRGGVQARAILQGKLAQPVGSALPRSRAPAQARLERRFRLDNWIVSQFALRRPSRVSVDRLSALAPRFFRRTPQALLVFFQFPARRPGRH